MKSAGTLFSRLILDLNWASEVVGRTIAELTRNHIRPEGCVSRVLHPKPEEPEMAEDSRKEVKRTTGCCRRGSVYSS